MNLNFFHNCNYLGTGLTKIELGLSKILKHEVSNAI